MSRTEVRERLNALTAMASLADRTDGEAAREARAAIREGWLLIKPFVIGQWPCSEAA